MIRHLISFTNAVLRVRRMKCHVRIAGPEDPPCLPALIALSGRGSRPMGGSLAAVLDRLLSTSLYSREMCKQSWSLALSVHNSSIKA